MNSFFTYLKRGLTRKGRRDRIAGEAATAGLKAPLRNLFPYVHRHWRKGGLGILLVAATSLLGFPQPLIIRYLIDDVILPRQLNLLVGAVFLLIAVAVAERLSRLMQQFYFARFEREIILDIQKDLLERTLRFPKSFFDKNQTGYLMSRLSSDVQGLSWFFSDTVAYAFENTIRFGGGIFLLIYLEWRLALGVLIILPMILYTVRFFSDRIHTLSHEGMEQHGDVSGDFQEAISSVTLIKSFSSENKTLDHVVSKLRGALHIYLEQSAVGATADLAIGTIPGIARALVLAIGAILIISGRWSLGSLLAFIAYLDYVFGPAHFLASANLQLQNSRAALERVSALFDIVPEDNPDTGIVAERLSGDIEFRHVSFSYSDREPVLEDVSFHIHPGERIAIIGPSGVGKTTLLSLILRFYKPQKGDIYFDGRPASAYELGSLRRRIGYSSQSPILVTGTIMENLRYGNPAAADEDVLHAARAAGIHDFITGLPRGYETDIREKGENFSEGQKQRLALARALVLDPDILVLDEPTSALDSRIEQSILDSLAAITGNKTLFIVTHRLAMIERSDRILVLNEKRLVATGTHSFLLETSDYYRQILTASGPR